MAKTYTLDEVREGIRAIVAEVGPDYIYIAPEEGCVYITNTDEPSCLIGRYLFSIGVSADTLRGCDQRGSISVILDLLADVGVSFTEDAVRWMRVVQARQDAKWRWGDALASADEEVFSGV